MERTIPARQYDFMGTDTYGWPLPARQSIPTERPATKPTAPISSETPPFSPLFAPEIPPVLPTNPAESDIVASPPAVFVEAPQALTPIGDAPDRPTVDTAIPPLDSDVSPLLPVAPTPENRLPKVISPTVTSISHSPPYQAENSELPQESHPAPTLEHAEIRQVPRFQAPSPFQQPQRRPNRPTDFWSTLEHDTMWADWRQVIEASTPQNSPAVDPAHYSPTHKYPNFSVERPNDLYARQVLRLYAGEKSVLTLAHSYLYNSICFKESCPQLAHLMDRFAAETHALAGVMGKLAFAFGADPRPRMLQSQRGQFWSGSYVQCVRNPRKAVLNLIELERSLLGELRRFSSGCRVVSVKVLVNQMVSDGEQRIATLNHSLTLGCL